MRTELYTIQVGGCELIVSRIGKTPFIAPNALQSGFIVCEYRAFKVPSKNRIRIDLFEDVSDDLEAAALKFGVSLAIGNEHSYLPWKKQSLKNGDDYFWVTLGTPIGFEGRFEQITAELETEAFTHLVGGSSQ